MPAIVRFASSGDRPVPVSSRETLAESFAPKLGPPTLPQIDQPVGHRPVASDPAIQRSGFSTQYQTEIAELFTESGLKPTKPLPCSALLMYIPGPSPMGGLETMKCEFSAAVPRMCPRSSRRPMIAHFQSRRQVMWRAQSRRLGVGWASRRLQQER